MASYVGRSRCNAVENSPASFSLVVRYSTSLYTVPNTSISSSPNGIIGIVDYAHTPDPVQNVLSTIQNIRKGTEQVITIIGCGGVFSANDAYTKIKLGASLVQLITGLIYEGPFLPSSINKKLPKLLAKDGFKHISEAVGVNRRAS